MSQIYTYFRYYANLCTFFLQIFTLTLLFSQEIRNFAAIKAKRTKKKMNVLELSEQEIGRRQSLQELRNMGLRMTRTVRLLSQAE